jgi:hypothetical protein
MSNYNLFIHGADGADGADGAAASATAEQILAAARRVLHRSIGRIRFGVNRDPHQSLLAWQLTKGNQYSWTE